MQFKNLAEEMTEKDLKEVLEIIYPDTIFSGYKRMEREIKIFFKLHGKILSLIHIFYPQSNYENAWN